LQATATVSGQLRPDATTGELLAATFPGGSVTGAPKVRAMQIIDRLEREPRGQYCGAVGFVSLCGTSAFNIAIRTLLRTGNEIRTWAGGGIVADSDCEAEYQECFHKMGAMMQALEEMTKKD